MFPRYFSSHVAFVLLIAAIWACGSSNSTGDLDKANKLVDEGNAAVDQVKNNQADYVGNVRHDERAELTAAYGPASNAPRLYLNPQPQYRYRTLNTSRPAFADPDIRRAVQYAIDRPAIAAIRDMTPNDDYLPPGVPGYAGTHPYPLANSSTASLSRAFS